MYLFNIRRKHVAGGTITKKSLATAVISGVANSYTYTGEPITANALTVRLDGVLLSANEDYTVSYYDNTEIGLASVAVTGMGNYYGVAVKEFYITSAPAGWSFKVEDMEYVGNVRTAAWQGVNLLSLCEDYEGGALLAGCALLNNLFLFGQKIARGGDGKIHVENMASSTCTTSNGSGNYYGARWVSPDGKKVYWRLANESKIVPATCAAGYDFANLVFDTSAPVDLGAYSWKDSIMVFTPDGTRAFSFSDSEHTNRVYFADMSTPFDLSTITSASYKDLSSIPTSYTKVINGMVFSTNGMNLLVTAGDVVYQFSLENAFDLSEVTLVSSKSTSSALRGIAVVNNSTTLLGVTSGGYVYEYNLVA